MRYIIHLVKYMFKKEYREAYDRKKKFAEIMLINKSIVR